MCMKAYKTEMFSSQMTVQSDSETMYTCRITFLQRIITRTINALVWGEKIILTEIILIYFNGNWQKNQNIKILTFR